MIVKIFALKEESYGRVYNQGIGDYGFNIYFLACNEEVRKMIDDKEAVDHPAHYCYGKHEVIDIIEDWNLGYHLGNAVKYIARCERKGKKIEDLKKAIWYLQREIDKEEKLKST